MLSGWVLRLWPIIHVQASTFAAPSHIARAPSHIVPRIQTSNQNRSENTSSRLGSGSTPCFSAYPAMPNKSARADLLGTGALGNDELARIVNRDVGQARQPV
jgi:hypothetical protein